MKRLLIGFAIIYSVIVPAIVFAATGFSGELLLGQTPSSNISSPRISTGSDNVIYVVWSEDDDVATSIFFTRSLDGGLSFEEKRELEKNTVTDVYITTPEIGVDSKGAVYIIYSRYDIQNGQFSFILRKSEDNGVNFDTQTVFAKEVGVAFTEENFAFFGSDIKIKNDCIYYVWSGSREIFLARSIDSGKNFEIIDVKEGQGTDDLLPVSFSKILPSLAIDSNNNIHVIWFESHLNEDPVQPKYNLYSAKLENNQSKFSESKLIANCDLLAYVILKPSIIVTSTDSIFIVWTKPSSSFAMFSKDGGNTFSELHEITFGNNGGVQSRKMIVDQNDVLHFLYLAAGNGALYYTKSSDLCNSFDKSIQAGSLSAMADMHLDEKKEKVYVVWEDPQKDGIYFSRSGEATDENIPAENTSEPGNSGGVEAADALFIAHLIDYARDHINIQ